MENTTYQIGRFEDILQQQNGKNIEVSFRKLGVGLFSHRGKFSLSLDEETNKLIGKTFNATTGDSTFFYISQISEMQSLKFVDNSQESILRVYIDI